MAGTVTSLWLAWAVGTVGGMVVVTTLTTTLMSYRSGKARGGSTITVSRDMVTIANGSSSTMTMCRKVLPTTSNPNVRCMLDMSDMNPSKRDNCALMAACLSTRNPKGGGDFASGKGGRIVRGSISGGGGATVGLAPGSKSAPICFMMIGSAALHLIGSDLRRTIDSLGCSVVRIG